ILDRLRELDLLLARQQRFARRLLEVEIQQIEIGRVGVVGRRLRRRTLVEQLDRRVVRALLEDDFGLELVLIEQPLGRVLALNGSYMCRASLRSNWDDPPRS